MESDRGSAQRLLYWTCRAAVVNQGVRYMHAQLHRLFDFLWFRANCQVFEISHNLVTRLQRPDSYLKQSCK